MHENVLAQKLDQIVQTGKQILQKSDHLDRLLTRVAENQLASMPSRDKQKRKREEVPADAAQSNTRMKGRKWKPIVGVTVSAIGLVSAVFSFFPHLKVSDPVAMDATDLFAYQMTVSNEGVLPIFRVKWALAPRHIKVATNGLSSIPLKFLCPHFAEWVFSGDVMARATNPSPQRHALLMFSPGGELTVEGPADYEFQIRPASNGIGTVAPGDQFTLTTEGLMSAPSGAVYDVADFAVAIRYTPIFPPLPMQACSHFYIFKDRQGTDHWFRATNQCDRFPWLHNWFSHPKYPDPAPTK